MSPSTALGITAFEQTRVQAQRHLRAVSNTAYTSNQTLVSSEDYCWAPVVNDRLNELCSLPVGWDGYAGLPVSFTCANFAARMLAAICNDNVPPPSLVPGSDGSLQVEWHRNMFDVELDVLDAQKVIATRVNLDNDEEEVIEVDNDFTEIVRWVSALSDDIETET